MSKYEGQPFAPNFPHDQLTDAQHEAVLQVTEMEHHIFVPLLQREARDGIFNLDKVFAIEALAAFTYPECESGFGYEAKPIVIPPEDMSEHDFMALCSDLVAPYQVKDTRPHMGMYNSLNEAGTQIVTGVFKWTNQINTAKTSESFLMLCTPKILASEEIAGRVWIGGDPERYAIAFGAFMFVNDVDNHINGNWWERGPRPEST